MFNVDDDDFNLESFVEHSVTCSTHWVDGAPHKQAIFCTECSEPDLRTGVQAVDVWSCEVLK